MKVRSSELHRRIERRLPHDLIVAEGGGVALIVALALPAITILTLGAVQLQAVATTRARTQDIADSAALWGAQQITITPAGVEERAVAWADAQLSSVKANATVKITATRVGQSGIKLAIDANMPSFFMNMFPRGGFDIHSEATAEALNSSPLCVATLGSGKDGDLRLTKTSKLQAPACLVHANRAIAADGGAMIQGQLVEAVTSASGPITPAAMTGAPVIDDPFASLPVDTSGCAGKPIKSKIGDGETVTLDAAVHAEAYDIKKGGTLSLNPGEHVFCGDIKLSGAGNIVGKNVVMILDDKVKLDWKDGGNVSLTGRESGPFAGFVIVDSRTHTGNLDINSDPITNITGAIYAPSAKLRIDGSKKAGASSDWTVVIAREFEAQNGASLVINANYGGSPVPVPNGVGNQRGGARITQ